MSTRKADRTLHRKTHKRVNRKMLVLLTMCMMLGSILFGQQTVWAAPASQTVSDVTVTVTTDREDYQSGDTVKTIVTIENHSTNPIKNIESQLILPEGLSPKDGSVTDSWTEVKAGERVEHVTEVQVTSDDVTTTNLEEDGVTDEKSETAMAAQKTSSHTYLIWIILVIIAVLVILGIIIYRQKGGKGKGSGKKLLSLFLCFLMLFSSIEFGNLIDAQAKTRTVRQSIVAEKEVTLDGMAQSIKANVSFDQEIEEASQDSDQNDAKNATKKNPVKNDIAGIKDKFNKNNNTKEVANNITDEVDKVKEEINAGDNSKDDGKDNTGDGSKDNGKDNTGGGSKDDGKDNPDPGTKEEQVTVTFDSQGGTPVAPVTVAKGTALDNIPQSYKTGQAFLGWYEDVECTTPFFTGTVVEQNKTVYAMFKDSEDSVNIQHQPDYYEEDCPTDKKVTLISSTPITAETLGNFVTLDIITGDEIQGFTVTANGNEYTIAPIGGYMEGGLYTMTAADGITFKGLESYVREYSFRIYKAPSEIVEVDPGIIYLDESKLQESNDDYIYQYSLSKQYFDEKKLATGKTVCIGDGTTNVTEDTLFLNITDCYQDEDDADKWYIICEDSDIEDVYKNVDISFKEGAYNELLKEGIDTEALIQELYASEGIQQLNLLMAAMLADSEEVQELLGGTSLLSNSNPSLLNFADNAKLKDDTLVDLSKKLGQHLQIDVKIGEAQNDNFADCNPDYWSAITFTISYKGTLKKKLKIDATVTIKEYLNISLQGYKSLKLKKKNLEFNYAVNVYSQTDIGFKVLVASKDGKWKDISSSVDKMFGSKEKNDPNSLVAEVQEMLANKGGYIELCRIPMFQVVKPLIEIFPLFSINLSLDYIVKVNFAAGISSQFSVLDATQIGIAGNSKTNTFRSYKNKLIGADRYSFDLTACGYIGIRTGLEGSMTLSFFGLKRLGEVGMSMGVGGYFDIYGYAKYHMVKPEQYYDTVYRTLAGGYYLEGGIYLEVSAIARSQIFRVEAKQTLVDHTWPLFSMGDEEVLLALDQPPTFYITTDDPNAYITRVQTKDLPPLTGTVFNIVTGETMEHATIPWSKVHLKFSNRNFGMYYGADRQPFLAFQKNVSWDVPSEESSAEIYYKGQYLQFTQSSSDDYNRTTTTAKVMFVNTSKVSVEDAGKFFTAKIYTEVDGVKTLASTRTVLAGNSVGYIQYDVTDEKKIYNGSWNMDPYTTPVNRDNMEFIYSGQKPQGLSVFKYRENGSDTWVAEIRAANIGDTPRCPSNTGHTYVYLYDWRPDTMSGYGPKKLQWYLFWEERDKIVSGYPTDEAVCKVTGDSPETVDAELKKLYPEEYEKTMYHYTGHYSQKDVPIRVEGLNEAGRGYVYYIGVPYGKQIDRLTCLGGPWWKPLEGFALQKDGEVVYKSLDDVTVTEPMELYGVYKTVQHTVTIKIYDDTIHDYVTYKTFTVDKGDRISGDIFDEAKAAVPKREGVTWNYWGWADQDNTSFVPDGTRVSQDTVLRMRFDREVDITFDPGEGTLVANGTTVSYSKDDYNVRLSGIVRKESDAYNTYKPVGWKNNATDETYGYQDMAVIKDPVTLTAIYEATPKEYKVSVYTAFGVLKNGQQTDSYIGGYNGYLEFMEKYNENWKPDTVVNPDKTYTSEGRQIRTLDDGLTTEITYRWNYTDNQYTLTFDANGGNLKGVASVKEYYGRQLKLSDLATATKSDGARDYVLSGWMDEDGTVYGTDDVITLTKDTKLTAIWVDGAYKEYKITYILDGAKIAEKIMHYNDALTDPGTPKEAEGLHFDGWEWWSGSEKLTEMPKSMPAADVTAYGTTTKRYVSYELDGSVYKTKEFAAIGSTVAVADTPVLTGYDVSDWTAEMADTAESVTITDGSFVMPDGDVVLKATTTPKKYQVTVNVDGQPVTGSPFTAEYLSRFALPELPVKEDLTFYWDNNSTDFSIMQENGIYYVDPMPAQDITINGYYTQSVHDIYFIVEGEAVGEWVPYKIIKDQVVGTTIWSGDIIPELKEEDAAAGKKFLGWVCFETERSREGSFQMPDHDVYYFTRWASEEVTNTSVGIEFWIGDPTEQSEVKPTVLGWWNEIYLKKGEILQLPDYQIEGYTLKWVGIDDTDKRYVYDPIKHTFKFDQIEDSDTISMYLYACYMKNEE